MAYVPRRARPAWLALLALDTRAAGVVRDAREPLLAQIKLAWWRDRLREDAGAWPGGEPLLAALAAWRGRHGALMGLVDGWEAVLVGEDGDAEEAAVSLAAGRAAACHGLAAIVGVVPDDRIAPAAQNWTRGDLAALGLKLEIDPRAVGPMDRVFRPLQVLSGTAGRPADGRGFFRALRLGLLGR